MTPSSCAPLNDRAESQHSTEEVVARLSRLLSASVPFPCLCAAPEIDKAPKDLDLLALPQFEKYCKRDIVSTTAYHTSVTHARGGEGI